MVKVNFLDLKYIDYKKAWDIQTEFFQKVVNQKLQNRDLPKESAKVLPDNYLLFCEHNHVYTLGKSGTKANILLDENQLSEKQISFYHINRGGDVTYHGPGQLTGYLIFDLDQFFTDIHKFLRYIEDAIILTLDEYGIDGGRIPGLTGIWVDYKNSERARKICAIGIHTGRWVTMHGFGFNINTNLEYFDYIIPCGIVDKGVTSMQEELGQALDFEQVKQVVKTKFAEVFDINLI